MHTDTDVTFKAGFVVALQLKHGGVAVSRIHGHSCTEINGQCSGGTSQVIHANKVGHQVASVEIRLLASPTRSTTPNLGMKPVKAGPSGTMRPLDPPLKLLLKSLVRANHLLKNKPKVVHPEDATNESLKAHHTPQAIVNPLAFSDQERVHRLLMTAMEAEVLLADSCCIWQRLPHQRTLGQLLKVDARAVGLVKHVVIP